MVIISKLSIKIVRKWCNNGARIRLSCIMGKGKEGEVIAVFCVLALCLGCNNLCDIISHMENNV